MHLVLAFCLVLGSVALAADAGFEERKKAVLEGITEREKAIGEAKACVAAAQNPEDMKKCKETRAAEMKLEREKMIDQRIKHLEEKKAKMEARKSEKGEANK